MDTGSNPTAPLSIWLPANSPAKAEDGGPGSLVPEPMGETCNQFLSFGFHLLQPDAVAIGKMNQQMEDLHLVLSLSL